VVHTSQLEARRWTWFDPGPSFFVSAISPSTGCIVVEVVIGENDRLDVALKQFQRKVIRAGVLKDLRRKRFYEKPSEARQRKAGAARQRSARALRRAH
jgi:ribosomal protein S21